MAGTFLETGAWRISPPRRWQWMLIALILLVLDYLSGPFLQFPILLVVPVVLATWRDGRNWGIATAVVLPVARMSFALHWGVGTSMLLVILDHLMDILILSAFAVLTHRFVMQERKIRVLQGLLPICAFCKRIRTEEQTWQQLEQYITTHSGATFSHTFCPECGQRHYGEYSR
jgi:hypothetical protein